MAPLKQKALDKALQALLDSEPVLSAPPSMHRRITEQVRIAMLRDLERKRFRYSVAALALSLVAAFTAAGILLSMTNLGLLMRHGVAGGLGRFDRLTTALHLSWDTYGGTYSLAFSGVLVGLTLAMGMIPLLRYPRAH